jgi:ferredoxin
MKGADIALYFDTADSTSHTFLAALTNCWLSILPPPTDECVDCGACEPVCPVEAIYYEDDVPEEWSDYTAANAEFFVDLGSPGGAAKLGPQEFDAPLLAAVPRKESES